MDGAPSNAIPIAEVARHLGISPRRARILAAEARLPAFKVGDRWVADRQALRSVRRVAGRPLSDRNVWGLLFLMSGEPAPWLEAVARSRLRKRALLRHLPREAPRLAGRARAHFYRNEGQPLDRILKSAQFVSSGVRIADEHGVEIAGDDIEGYLPEPAIEDVAYRAALRPVSPRAANVIIHGVEGFWPFGGSDKVPIAVALLDLLESGDQRSQRAARAFARR